MAGILTPTQQQEAWNDLVNAVAPKGPNQPVMPFAVPDLVAAVQAADAWATANAASFNTALPDPFKSTATAAQKAALLAFVALRRYSG